MTKNRFRIAAFVLILIIALDVWGEMSITYIEPSRGSCTGFYEVILHGKNFHPEGNEVRVGGVSAVGVRYLDSNNLFAILQGSSVSGHADVQLYNIINGSCAALKDGFFFDPPKDPAFDRMYALGASYSTGIQSYSTSYYIQAASPVVQIAKQAGAYMGMPLVVFQGVPVTVRAESVCIGHNSLVWDPVLQRMVFVPEGKLYNPVYELGNEVRNIIRAAVPVIVQNFPLTLSTFRLDPDFDNISNFSVPVAWMIDVLME